MINLGSTTSNSTNKTMRMLDTTTSSSSDSEIWPLVFYGTACALAVKILINLVFGFIHVFLIRPDEGY